MTESNGPKAWIKQNTSQHIESNLYTHTQEDWNNAFKALPMKGSINGFNHLKKKTQKYAFVPARTRCIGLALPRGKITRAAQLLSRPWDPTSYHVTWLLGHSSTNWTPPCGTSMAAWSPWEGSTCQPWKVTVGPSARCSFSPPGS